jgi:hypothetical protein
VRRNGCRPLYKKLTSKKILLKYKRKQLFIEAAV